MLKSYVIAATCIMCNYTLVRGKITCNFAISMYMLRLNKAIWLNLMWYETHEIQCAFEFLTCVEHIHI